MIWKRESQRSGYPHSLKQFLKTAVTTGNSGGYFFLSLKIWYNRLIRATTNVQNKKKSWYVIIVIPSFLFGLEGKSLRQWRAAALALRFSRAVIIACGYKNRNLNHKKTCRKTGFLQFRIPSLTNDLPPMLLLYCNDIL